MSDRSPASAMRWSAMGADCANSIVKRSARRSRRNCCRNRTSTSGSSSTTRMRGSRAFSGLVKGHTRARQNDPKFGELAGLGIDLYRPPMLLDDDVVTDGKAEPSPFSGRLCRKERVEHLFLHFGWNASAIVANPDFNAVAEVFGRSGKGGLEVAAIFSALRLVAA